MAACRAAIRWQGALGQSLGKPGGQSLLQHSRRLPGYGSFTFNPVLRTALAVSDGIAAHIEPGLIELKWPNDILVGGAKICGILLERCGDHVVVGTGVNVAVTPEVKDRQVTSLLDEGADPELSAETLLQEIAASFDQWLFQWRRDGLLPILQEWRKRAHAEGTMLTINKRQQQFANRRAMRG